MSLAHKNYVFTEKHRNNLSAAQTGKRHSDASKQKMSRTRKGMVSPRKGCKLTPETISKMIESRKWYRPSPESNEKNRQTHIRLGSVQRLRTGKPVWNKGQIGIQKHSEETRNKISATNKLLGRRPPLLVGSDHYNWRGGVTPESLKIRNSAKYDLWRTSVFQRDNWTCQKYGTRGGVIQAHHILSFHDNPDLRFDLNNGITLSKRAHSEFHNKYGRGNNTPEQLAEFLAP